MKLDLQDGLFLFGVFLLEWGVAAIYIPAALILAGVLCLFASVALAAGRSKK